MKNILSRALCGIGLHTPWYLYGPEIFLTWEQIKSGMEKPPLEHLGCHCQYCGRKYRHYVRCIGARPSLWRRIITFVQPL